MRWTLAAVVAALSIVGLEGAYAGDPLRVHRTVESDHFVVHYYEPLEDVARRIAVIAETAHATLAPAFDHRPTEKTIIVVVDDTDGANGFASVLPRNQVQIFATAPGSFTELDDHDDWLNGLTSHEYTHVLHLDTMRGPPVLYNKIFGKTWAPNQIMPRWVIEGIATYVESKYTSGGRNRGTRFDQFIRIARHANKDLRLDQITGSPRVFPRGNAPYVYGSHFIRYVMDRYGADTLRQMSHASGEHPIPFAVNRQIAKVVGRPFTDLYDDWKAYLRDRYGMQELAAERRGLITGRKLTHNGETNWLARYSADGKELYWLQYDGYRDPKLRAMPVVPFTAPLRQARDVFDAFSVGPYDVLSDGTVVFEQGRLFRRDYAFQDLMIRDGATGEQRRLTLGRRARDPAVSKDGRRIAYSQNDASQSVLAVMDAVPDAPASVVWKGDRYDQAFQPAWSPDGTRIAFSAWRKGGFRDILVVELASGAIERITNDRAVDMSPAWSADGRTLYFDSDRTGISNIYAHDLETRETWQLTNVLGGAFHASPSPDGTRIAFEAAVPRGGYDLYELEIDRASWLPARDYVDDRPATKLVPDDAARVSAARPYRPLESLGPQAWSAQLNTTGTPSMSIQTSGTDAFGLHSWALGLSSNTDTKELNLGGSYAYTRWRQVLRLGFARTVVNRTGRIDGSTRAFREEDWSVTASSSIPFESRPSISWSLSFDFDADWFRKVGDEVDVTPDPNDRVPVLPATDYVQTGLGARVSVSTSRGAIYGVGSQRGFDAAVGFRLDHPALGATYRTLSVNYSANRYQRLWGSTPVLALRLAGSFRAGDLVRTGTYALGGIPAQDVARSILDSTRYGSTGYLRGFPERTVIGNQYHLLNVEYRQELAAIERGLATLPVYLRRVHLALLSDVGTAFDTELQIDRQVRASVGAALRLDAFFGYFIPGTFEVGYAHGLTDGGIGQTWLLLTGTL